MNCLGRFTLRSGSYTIGYGEVKKLYIKDALLTKEQKEQLGVKDEKKPATEVI